MARRRHRKEWRVHSLTKGALRARLSRAGWGVGDQFLYALSNAVLTFVAAHFLAADEFGRFALLFTTTAIILGLVRAMTSEPYTVLTGTEGRCEQQQAVRPTLGLSVVLGLACGAPLIATGLISREPLFLVFGIAAVPIVWQDCVRYVLIAHQRAGAAFANDLVWLGVQFGATVLVISAREPTAADLAGCWAVGAAAGCIFGVSQLGAFPGSSRMVEWWKRSRRYSSYYTLEFMILAGSGYSVVYFIALISGLTEAGAYRGAQALYGPVAAVVGGLRMVALPAMVRRRPRGKKEIVRLSLMTGGALAGLTVFAMIALWLTRGLLGPFLLGATAAAALPLIIPMGLGRAATSATTGALLGMRTLGMTKRSLGARIAVAVLTMACAIAGAAAWGSLGAAWGFAMASAIGTLVWFAMLQRSRAHLGVNS